MKTAQEIVELIDLQTAGEDHNFFEIEIEEKKVFTRIMGEVSRRYIATYGGEYCGLKECIDQCVDASIHIDEISSFNEEGDEITPIYAKDDIERYAFTLTY